MSRRGGFASACDRAIASPVEPHAYKPRRRPDPTLAPTIEDSVPQDVGLLKLRRPSAGALQDRAAITQAGLPAAIPDRRVSGPDPLDLHGLAPAGPLPAALS